MTPRHMTSLVAIFVCNLLLSCAQSAPNAALLKLLAAKHSHDSSSVSLPPSSFSSYVSHNYNTAFPAGRAADDVNAMWLDSAGSSPLLMRGGNALTSAGSATTPEEEAEEAKEGLLAASKRFHPSAFFGSRGKREFQGLSDAYAKRFFQQGFVGSRGKRLPAYLLNGGRLGNGEEGEQEEEDEEEEEEEEQGLAGKRMMSKKFAPSAFTGARGKRYLPGLEALFLSQMYKKLDAEKWKRQSLLGFHAARG